MNTEVFNKIMLVQQENESIEDTLNRVLNFFISSKNIKENVVKNNPLFLNANFEFTGVESVAFPNVKQRISDFKSEDDWLNKRLNTIEQRIEHSIMGHESASSHHLETVYFNSNELKNIRSIEHLLHILLASLFNFENKEALELITHQKLDCKPSSELTESKYVKGLFKEKVNESAYFCLYQIYGLSKHFDLDLFVRIRRSEKTSFNPTSIIYIDFSSVETMPFSFNYFHYDNYIINEHKDLITGSQFVRVAIDNKDLGTFNNNWPELMSVALCEFYYLFGESVFDYSLISPVRSIEFHCESGNEKPDRDESTYVKYIGQGSANYMNVLKKLVYSTGIPIFIEIKNAKGEVHQFDLRKESIVFQSSHRYKKLV